MQTIYIPVTLKQADYIVKRIFEKGVKKGVKLMKKGVKS